MTISDDRGRPGPAGDRPPPSGPLLISTVEVRWFFDGGLPTPLDRWIEDREDPRASSTRIDRYIRLPGAPHTGIKLREGRIEVKSLVGNLHPSEAIPGAVEWWVKWSQPIPGDPPQMEGPGIEIIQVAKNRRAWFEDGLLREVTEVAAGPRRGWTVGLEGPVTPESRPVPGNLVRAVGELMEVEGVAALLTPQRSASYPKWLQGSPSE